MIDFGNHVRNLYKQFDVPLCLDQQAGWWWRRPYGALLRFWRKLWNPKKG